MASLLLYFWRFVFLNVFGNIGYLNVFGILVIWMFLVWSWNRFEGSPINDASGLFWMFGDGCSKEDLVFVSKKEYVLVVPPRIDLHHFGLFVEFLQWVFYLLCFHNPWFFAVMLLPKVTSWLVWVGLKSRK